ncbi:MAG: AMP-binding protein [Rhizomicrobium sp.]
MNAQPEEGLRFDRLLNGLADKRGAIVTLAQGAPVRHGFAGLAADVARAKEQLLRWKVKAGTRVGMFAPNSYAYVVYDLALIAIHAIPVGFTDDFAREIGRELVERYRLALMLLAKSVAHSFTATDKFVALLDGENGDVEAIAREPYADGDEPDDLCLAFSSGSAGGLKGLVISRKGAETTLPPVVDAVEVTHRDRLLLFLPMSNFQQRMMYYAAIGYDFDVAVTDYTQLYPAMKILEPTILIAPPVFFHLTHNRFAAACNGWRIKALARLIAVLPGRRFRRTLARHAFKDVHGLFGRRMRLLISGMAPLNRSAIRFFDAVQLPLCESYGLAETGSLTYRPAFSRNRASVGKPLKGVTIEFADDGEIAIRREAFLTRKYFQCAAGENENTFQKGRVLTGDIGEMDGEGWLRLLGRKKELIVTPGGFKIHPEVLEGELNLSPDIVQSVIFQKMGVGHLTCVVVPGGEASESALKRIRGYADRITRDRKVRIGEILLAEEPFSAQNGLLRPNLKLDRKAIAARYAT